MTIKLRQAHLDAFGTQAEAAFVTRIVTHLRVHHSVAVQGLADDVLTSRVQTGLSRGRRHGLTWESSLTGFVALMFEVAPNFDEQPRIWADLADGSVSPDQRFERLGERVTDEDWEAAARSGDPDSWIRTL